MALDPHAMDQSVTYQDMEPMIESIVSDPLPDGLVDPEWLDLPEEIEPDWLDLPEIEPGWLELPELEQVWLQAIDQETPSVLSDIPVREHDLDWEH
jgi:hypothetical protein